MPHSAASDHDLQCLPLSFVILDTSTDLLIIKDKYGMELNVPIFRVDTVLVCLIDIGAIGNSKEKCFSSDMRGLIRVFTVPCRVIGNGRLRQQAAKSLMTLLRSQDDLNLCILTCSDAFGAKFQTTFVALTNVGKMLICKLERLNVKPSHLDLCCLQKRLLSSPMAVKELSDLCCN